MVFAQFLIVKPSDWWRPARLSCKTIKSSRHSIEEFDGYRWKLLFFGFFYVLLLAVTLPLLIWTTMGEERFGPFSILRYLLHCLHIDLSAIISFFFDVSEDLTCDSTSNSNTLRLIETFSCACSMPLATFLSTIKSCSVAMIKKQFTICWELKLLFGWHSKHQTVARRGGEDWAAEQINAIIGRNSEFHRMKIGSFRHPTPARILPHLTLDFLSFLNLNTHSTIYSSIEESFFFFNENCRKLRDHGCCRLHIEGRVSGGGRKWNLKLNIFSFSLRRHSCLWQ